jgi:hypothetical protein
VTVVPGFNDLADLVMLATWAAVKDVDAGENPEIVTALTVTAVGVGAFLAGVTFTVDFAEAFTVATFVVVFGSDALTFTVGVADSVRTGVMTGTALNEADGAGDTEDVGETVNDGVALVAAIVGVGDSEGASPPPAPPAPPPPPPPPPGPVSVGGDDDADALAEALSEGEALSDGLSEGSAVAESDGDGEASSLGLSSGSGCVRSFTANPAGNA